MYAHAHHQAVSVHESIANYVHGRPERHRLLLLLLLQAAPADLVSM